MSLHPHNDRGKSSLCVTARHLSLNIHTGQGVAAAELGMLAGADSCITINSVYPLQVIRVDVPPQIPISIFDIVLVSVSRVWSRTHAPFKNGYIISKSYDQVLEIGRAHV